MAARQARRPQPQAPRPDGRAAGLAAAAAVGDAAAGPEPVIALTYAHAGALELQARMALHPQLACTAGTGLLTLCHQAAATWRRIDGRGPGAPMTQLAASSVRRLAVPMMIAGMAGTGARRFYETAADPPEAAGTFVTLFPATKVLCVHRSCPAVIRAALAASPWGLVGPAFAPYLRAYPGSTFAALLAWWIGHTAGLLAFERAYPEACLRVRREDLAASPAGTLDGIRQFVGLEPPPPWLAPPPPPPGSHAASEDQAGVTAGFPFDQAPAMLRDRAAALHAELGYPPPGDF